MGMVNRKKDYKMKLCKNENSKQQTTSVIYYGFKVFSINLFVCKVISSLLLTWCDEVWNTHTHIYIYGYIYIYIYIYILVIDNLGRVLQCHHSVWVLWP